MKKIEQTQRDYGDTIECNCRCIKRVPEGERLFEEIMAENISNLMKDINLHIKKLNELQA